jgi:hypothetical protein
MLKSLSFTNYRCFRTPQHLAVRPVTVVLGKNNSGKSAFTRAASVLQTGFPGGRGETLTTPLDLDRLGSDSVTAFTDLVHLRDDQGSIQIGLTFDDSRLRSIDAQVQNDPGERLQAVAYLKVEMSHGTWALSRTPDGRGYEQIWAANDGGTRTTTGPMEFHGLVPRYLPREILQRDGGFELAQHCATAYGRIRYISPFREPVRREHYLPIGTPKSVGERGQHFAAVLAHDHVRGEGRICQQVNEMMREVLPDWTLEEIADGTLFTTVLRSRSDPGLTVNIADSGSGVAQVLPLLIQQALDTVSGRQDPILYIVEEPELHLHPAAHAQLADHYLSAARVTGNRFLIETHSEALLLRLRRRIAEGTSSPDDIGVYFVHHDGRAATAEHIAIDETGQLSSWPEGVFTEDFDEVRALTAAQMRRSGINAARA